ncbi:hypothetical protein BFJ66_g17224 [Fusarium oxysporum f. sp. cepae]|uniref:Uncharacterized protein n=1 Tax=Fusarium oxysporum f. sp. cepae TaxID=396571 RepID=A0A3L6MPL4_FUSOX|nr:hypothetical protein BFJ65_g18837 [Fusarium oxysporum f. sp. cepae]RKK15371.1 hypothetical protein BFJ65_g11906 [Fusarium oxysporum f. sp. cepae]RKK23768.1 hypothetical protein BFJ67_g16985 [Fusarium oxysporum f. sp. cepae]RKK24103.1 hypothetical protein BFJ66_g17224 [Fusarium oxysporum f. sp. cepae]
MSDQAFNVASLALSTVALIELYNVCLGGVDFVCRAKSTSRSIQELISQINIERHRLAIWGRRWGLLTKSRSEIDHDLDIGDLRQIVQSSLTSIEMAVCDLETIQSKYGLNFATATQPRDGTDTVPEAFDQDPVHHSTLSASRETWERRIQDRQRLLERMQAASYSFSDEDKLSRLSRTISWHVQRLWDLLLVNMMPGIERQLISDVLASITTESELKLVRSTTDIPTLRQHADNDLTARELSRSATDPSQTYTMRRRYGSVKPRPPFAENSTRVIAHYSDVKVITGRGQRQQRTPVLLEWKRGDWPSEISQQMEARVNNLALLLSRIKSGIEAESYRVLECMGYFEDDKPNTFGIFYRLPKGADPNQSPVSLSEFLAMGSNHLDRVPSLDARIHLAKCLVISLHEFHSSGWLHKQICSQNIVFFKSESSDKFNEDSLAHPYMVGFGISRPESDQWGTETKGSKPISLHRHPGQDSDSSARYHDIYSLGLVLLEIAQWRSLQDISDEEAIAPASFHNQILSVARTIDIEVGKTYCDVVQTMLESVQKYTWVAPQSMFTDTEEKILQLSEVYEGKVLRDFYYSVVDKLVSAIIKGVRFY